MATIRGDARVMLLMLRGFHKEARLPGALASRLPVLEQPKPFRLGTSAVQWGARPSRALDRYGRQTDVGARQAATNVVY